MVKRPFFACVLAVLSIMACTTDKKTETSDYATLNNTILKGWNTWDNRSISTQVLMPDGVAFNIRINDTVNEGQLSLMFPGNRAEGSEKVWTIAHTPDGSFTDFYVTWRGIGMRVQTASEGDELHILVTPSDTMPNTGTFEVVGNMLYGKPGAFSKENARLTATLPDKSISLSASVSDISGPGDTLFRFAFGQPVALSTDKKTSADKVKKIIQEHSDAYWQTVKSKGKVAEVYNVIQNSLNWLVVHDHVKNRAITPVSRPWSYGWGNRLEGGYVLFCWDNFFAAYMYSIESKQLAFNEAIQMCNEIDDCGFVPNYSGPFDIKSRDRSQPPVGSMMVLEIYKKYPERWFLEKVFDQLLTWNRWWETNRDTLGYLCWGSNPAPSPTNDKRELTQNCFEAASNESGLDNTPMYDGVVFDTLTHLLPVADVGLMGLYVGDCQALAEIAALLGRKDAQDELLARADKYNRKLSTMWSEEKGIYLNYDLVKKQPSTRISPTNFYPLISKTATQQQAERMIKDHFYNPDEFWGVFIMPSIARNDTAYTGKDYWRGSIWGPMNFLVYWGMRNYDLTQARTDMAQKSANLLLGEWNRKAWVRENYHAETGTFPGSRSDHFYHWGALLGMIYYLEHHDTQQ